MLPSNNFQFTHIYEDHDTLYTAVVSNGEVEVTWQWNIMDDGDGWLEPRTTYSVQQASKCIEDGLWVLWQEPALD